MTVHQGGCICGAVQYETLSDPLRVTVCHCRFCQRATGSAYLVEPIFRLEDLKITRGSATTYQHRSEGSGKLVYIHFCAACGTKLYLSFERFPDVCGIYAGTFDEPSWFEIRPDNSKHIFLEVARHDTIIPAGIKAYDRHATQNDGTPIEPMLFDAPQVTGVRRSRQGRS
jgi:hypothetical protein